MAHHISIGGVSVADGVSDEEADEIHKLRKKLTKVRGVGLKTAGEILAKYPSTDAVLEAGVDGLFEMDGMGPKTAERIIEEAERGGWQGEVPLKIEHNPDDEKPYRVEIDSVYSSVGYDLKPTLIEVAERAAEQKLLDKLR